MSVIDCESAAILRQCQLFPASTAPAGDLAFASNLILTVCEISRRNVDTISGVAFSVMDARPARRL